jgi:glycosyltransferase involved in cell wall biosynthesis
MLNLLEVALNEVIQGSFLGLHGRPASATELAHYRKVLVNGARLEIVLKEIASRRHAAQQTQDPASEVVGVVRHLYRLALNRQPTEDEISFWSRSVEMGEFSVAALVNEIATSPEATASSSLPKAGTDLPSGRFVQMLFEIVLSRGAQANEIQFYQNKLADGEIDRPRLLQEFLQAKTDEFLRGTPPPQDPTIAYLLGTDEFADLESWKAAAPDDHTAKPAPRARSAKVPSAEAKALIGPATSRGAAGPDWTPKVSIITSLYKGGKYIQAFLENICSQSIFPDCELIIIDASSPENEQETIEQFAREHPNICSIRLPSRISIYEAWNYGISISRGTFLTNANLDDMRRSDSLERQLETFEIAPFADIAYQDVYYSFEPGLTFEQVAARGFKTNVPVVSPYNLLQFNSPHNAPMWRRSLHDELGFFDGSYKSAGDHDFWLRCIAAGKIFFKMNDAHVIYFVNPEGLSTRADTRGVEENCRITRIYGRKLISPRLVESDEEFERAVLAAGGSAKDTNDSAEPLPKREQRYQRVQRSLRGLSVRSRAEKAPPATVKRLA